MVGTGRDGDMAPDGEDGADVNDEVDQNTGSDPDFMTTELPSSTCVVSAVNNVFTGGQHARRGRKWGQMEEPWWP